jgi:hypothetical protein
LTAELAVQRSAEIRGNLATHPPVDEAELSLTLNLVTDAHAQAALDAQVHVEPNKMGLVVHVEIA